MKYTLSQELLIHDLTKEKIRSLHDQLNDRKVQLRGWHKLKFNSKAESGASRQEVLWCNYEPTGQLSLFG